MKQTFCRNKYNLTGLCSRMACPLANSRYATIIEHDGKLVLYVKTVERAHSPRALWEKIKLSTNYRKALVQIDKHMEYWPEWYIHKAKQRLTKMTQYLLRKRRLELRSKTRLVGVKKKVSRREAVREKKAVVAAKVESAIEKELLERLRSGTYGDIYNYPHEEYERALDEEVGLSEEEMEEEEEFSGEEYEAQMDDEDESEEEEEEVADMEDNAATKDDGGRFDFDDFSDEDDEASESAGSGDDEDVGGKDEGDQKKDMLSKLRARAKKRAAKRGGKGGKGRKGRRVRRGVEMEYEREDQEQRVLETTD